MTWSLLNAMIAKQVEGLLDAEPIRQDLRDDERMMPREQALRVIHATLWAYSSRGGDFSGCYALSALADALKDRLPVLEHLNTWTPTPDTPTSEHPMTDEQIKHMVNRFLGWRLPENFAPDDGISFEPLYNVEYNAARGLPPARRHPSGTNLLDAVQAEAMIRYLVEGMPADTSGESQS